MLLIEIEGRGEPKPCGVQARRWIPACAVMTAYLRNLLATFTGS